MYDTHTSKRLNYEDFLRLHRELSEGNYGRYQAASEKAKTIRVELNDLSYEQAKRYKLPKNLKEVCFSAESNKPPKCQVESLEQVLRSLLRQVHCSDFAKDYIIILEDQSQKYRLEGGNEAFHDRHLMRLGPEESLHDDPPAFLKSFFGIDLGDHLELTPQKIENIRGGEYDLEDITIMTPVVSSVIAKRTKENNLALKCIDYNSYLFGVKKGEDLYEKATQMIAEFDEDLHFEKYCISYVEKVKNLDWKAIEKMRQKGGTGMNALGWLSYGRKKTTVC